MNQITKQPPQSLQVSIDLNDRLMAACIRALKSEVTSANLTALQLLGCLTVLSDDCGELFVNDQQKGLDMLYLLLKRGMRETNKLTLWLLSNLSAGSQV